MRENVYLFLHGQGDRRNHYNTFHTQSIVYRTHVPLRSEQNSDDRSNETNHSVSIVQRDDHLTEKNVNPNETFC
jgi:hypothetical protein